MAGSCPFLLRNARHPACVLVRRHEHLALTNQFWARTRYSFGVGAIFFFGSVSPVLNGALLVVSQQNAAASDENPGSEELPLKTISAAAAKVKAGDRVLIHRGDYRETVIITASGTETAPIVFEAAPGETVVIKGSNIIREWEREEGSIWKAHLKTPAPRGPSGKEAAFWETNDVRQVFTRDGILLDAQRLRRVTSREAIEAGTFFCDPVASVLLVWLADSGSPIERPPEVSVRGAWLFVFGRHIIVRGIAMRHASTTAIANWPACGLSGENITLENCVITWGDFAGVSLSGKLNRLLQTTVACHGACGIGGTGENHVIENCRVIFNNVNRYDTQWHAGGAKLIPNFRHGTIRHNEFAHNLGPGLWLDGQCDENVIDGNLAHDNEGPGIMVEISSGNRVLNNVAFANRNLLSGPYRDEHGVQRDIPYSEQRIAPSRLVRLYHAGDGRGIYISSSPRTKVLHNTAYLNEGEGICVEGPPRSDVTGTVAAQDYVVLNNICAFNHGSQLTVQPREKAKDSRAISDYNLLFSVGAVLAKNGWAGNSTFDLKEWQKTSGQDAHSVDADPQFAMAAMEDLRLLKTSPVIVGGKPLAEVGHDYFGHPRGREKTAMGACERPAEIYPIPLRNHLSTSSAANENGQERPLAGK